ncbi:MAG: hypothetical protein SOZ36_00340 [Atopobiaceae bacterium]|uniref:Tryptophan transporter n=1 Tax=Olsenella absiana TaxID=3115222 RepID=A0ABU7R945_9ACTN|nr:hypothetical protein [Olsenella sp.]MDY3900112.1 hypothetical protein [Atopobiaceae bacterium]
MSQSQATTQQQPRTYSHSGGSRLDVRALVLLAVLLAAGMILNFTVGKAISGFSGGLISPEFIISAFCLTILVVRPKVGEALVIGLISAAVIQVTTTSPFIDFAAEGVAAMLMAQIVRVGMRGAAKRFVPFVGTLVTTVVSGVIFMLIKIALVGAASQLVAAMLPVVIASGAFNAILVQALYLPIRKALKIEG